MKNDIKHQKEVLKCVKRGCKKLQTIDGEFCKEHWKFMQLPNRVDTADICELASELTLRECREKKIVVDKQVSKDETCYTAKAQHIFDYYYDTITNTLRV